MFKSGIMYTAWLFDNVVIFNFCIGADTSKYVNPLDHFINTINQEHFDIISHMLHFRGRDYWDEMNRYLTGNLKVSGKVSSHEEAGSSKQS